MSGRWVLEASAAVRLTMRLDGALPLAETLGDADLVLAPTLYCAETANAIWKYVRAGQLDTLVAVTRCEESRQLVDHFVADCDLQIEALALASQQGHPVYDCLYTVLARRHAAGVISRDQRLIELLLKVGIRTA